MNKKTLIIGVGDSLTAGTPYFESPLEAPPNGRGDKEGPYAYWMMSKKPTWDVRNMGVAGETSAEIRARFDLAVKLTPRFIIILAGTNDIVQGESHENAADNLAWMYRAAKNETIIPVAVTLPPFDRATPFQAAQIDVLNRWIRKEAEMLRIPLVDANQLLRSKDAPHKLDASPDGYHPDMGGYRSLGMKLIEAIEPVDKTFR